MLDFLIGAPNWIKPLPGLAMLGVSYLIYYNGYIWPWGWAIGGVLLCAGILLMKSKSESGYNF